MNQAHIRNFCIIAHIDHGKSTLADRFLELTKTVSPRDLQEQTLDQMDLERERGITIKLQPVTMAYQGQDGNNYQLNLIDTPGHVDFSYEVSRSLAAVEGALLLVDATQGIQAQTLANLYLALEENLTIIPVINKIDLPNAQVENTERALKDLLGDSQEEILKISAKTGEGVPAVLEAITQKIPHPEGQLTAPPQALIFDSVYNPYKGVVTYIRLMNGSIQKGEELYIMGTQRKAESLEVGIFNPKLIPTLELTAGQIGYIATGLKKVSDSRVGDTITTFIKREIAQPLRGYREAKPMVFASFFPLEGEKYPALRDALDKLSLNDASFVFQPENSQALGRGFRGGFLGLLHLEIIKERLEREFNLDLVFTTPSVKFKVKLKGSSKTLTIHSPAAMPDPSSIESIAEPWVKLEIITAAEYLGKIMEYMATTRGRYRSTNYLDPQRAVLSYEMPLAEVITNLHDALKTVSQGFASLSYEFTDFEVSDLVRLDFLVAGEIKEELSRIIPREKSRRIGIAVLEKLKNSLPKENFAIILQAAIGGKIIARKDISAMRKDVLAKLYGGDRTRKDKLLKKQKKGKARLLDNARVNIPTQTYMEIMKTN